MTRLIGTVKELQNGEFFIKDAQGNIKTLKVGDEIFENDLVYGAQNNTNSAQLIIDIANTSDAIVYGSNEFKADLSVIAAGFEPEEAVVAKDAFDNTLNIAVLDTPNTEETQAGTLEEPAAGDGGPTDTEQPTNTLFASRDGLNTNVATTLRSDTINDDIEIKLAGDNTTDLNNIPSITVATGNGENANDTLYESALRATNATGEKIAVGTFTIADIDSLDNIASITLAGTPFSANSNDGFSALIGQSVTTTYGSIQITSYNGDGEFAYKYTLISPADNQGNIDPEVVQDVLSVVVSDLNNATATASITINIIDDVPTAATPDVNLLEINEFTITNHNEVSSAGYNSSYGYYIKDADGNPTTGVVVWDNVKDADTDPVTVSGYTPDQVGFFIIPNGDTKNPNLSDNTEVTFIQDSAGHWQAITSTGTPIIGQDSAGHWQAITSTGTPIIGQGSNVIFDNGSLNNDAQDHVTDNTLVGNQNWEDLQIPNGDGDFNDVNVDVQWTVGVARLDESSLSDDGIYSTTFDVSQAFSGTAAGSYGADGAGTTVYSLALNTEESGSGIFILDESAPNGKGAEIKLITNSDGSVSGTNGTEKIFNISIDSSTGELTFAYENPTDPVNIWHPDTTSTIYKDDQASLHTAVANTLVVTQTITDADGDSATSGALDIGNGEFFKIEDDGPRVQPYKTDSMRIISDDDTVSGLNGNPGGDGDNQRDYNLNGTLQFDAGTDGGKVAWDLDKTRVDNGATNASFSVDTDGSLILTQTQDGSSVQVAKITLNETTGKYVYTQTANLLHVDDGSNTENEAAFTLGFKVTDVDGDKANGYLKLLIDDDTPTIKLVTNTPNIVLEESFEVGENSWNIARGSWGVNGDSNTNVTGDHGAVWRFKNDAGVEIQSQRAIGDADAIDGNNYAELDPNIRGTNTSMSTTVSLTSSDVYTLEFAYQPRILDGSYDSGDMKVTFANKELTIDSDANGNLTITPSDDSVQYTTNQPTANGWITFNVTYSGITGTEAVLAFEGLGTPETYGALLDNIKLTDTPMLIVDESYLTKDAIVDFSAMFSQTANAGADGQATLTATYNLNVKAENSDSGLVDTATGEKILLSEDTNGNIVGKTETTAKTVFMLSVDSQGKVTLNQERAIEHADTNNPDDTVTLSVDDLVTLTKSTTITDNDGDTATDSATINIGQNLIFKDDAPRATNDTNQTTAEDNPVLIDVLANDEVGADGYATSNPIVISQQPTNGTAKVVQDSGVLKIKYTPNKDYSGTDEIQYTLTDKDGDVSAPASVSINVTPVADAPNLIMSLSSPTVTLGDNLIVNGSFEDISGNNGTTTYDNQVLGSGKWVSRTEIPGWKLDNESDTSMDPMEIVNYRHGGVGKTDGLNYMDLGASPGNTAIYQTLTLSRGTYQLSFDYADKALIMPKSTASGKMEVLWNGAVVATVDGDNEPWLSSSMFVDANEGENKLTFKEIGIIDNHGIAIDNVQLHGVTYTYDLSATATLNDNETLGDVVVTGLPDGVSISDMDVATDGTSTARFETHSPLSLEQINAIQGSLTSTDGTSVATTVEHTIATVSENSIDTLMLPAGTNIDFSVLDKSNNPFNGIETLDLSASGANEVINLSLSDVIDMTDTIDGKNTLTILGDSSDSVNVSSVSVAQSTEGGFDIYTYTSTASGDPTVIVKIDEDITQS